MKRRETQQQPGKKHAATKTCDIAERCAGHNPPLCPLQAQNLSSGVWYSDEAICTAEKYQGLHWVKIQKEISRLKRGPDAGFYTVEMLKLIRAASPDITGADPDDPASERKWLKEHPRHNGRKQAVKPSPSIPIHKRKATPTQGTFSGF